MTDILPPVASRSIFSDWLEDARWARIWFSLQPKERRREPQRMDDNNSLRDLDARHDGCMESGRRHSKSRP